MMARGFGDPDGTRSEPGLDVTDRPVDMTEESVQTPPSNNARLNHGAGEARRYLSSPDLAAHTCRCPLPETPQSRLIWKSKGGTSTMTNKVESVAACMCSATKTLRIIHSSCALPDLSAGMCRWCPFGFDRRPRFAALLLPRNRFPSPLHHRSFLYFSSLSDPNTSLSVSACGFDRA